MKETIDAIGDSAPIVAIGLFALPSYIGVLRQRGFLRGLMIVLILGLLAIGLDTIALKTGVPYGQFSYDDALGYKLLGSTPWTIALIYPPILLAAFWLASKVTMKRGRLILTAAFVTFTGIVLNPAIVKLELWKWETAGQFYGVPILNFVGLFAGALLSGWLLMRLWGKEHEVRASIAFSGLALLLFWTGVNIGVEQWIPVGLGAFGALVLLVILVLEKKQLKREKKA